jgi:nucleoside-diphosphate-sugar epimerase
MTKNKRRLLITGASGFIGTNYIEMLRTNSPELEICNFDKAAPQILAHQQYWREGNLLEQSRLQEIVTDFAPTEVVHLAARTDTLSDKLADYEENHLGTANLLTAIHHCPSVERVVITSTQFIKRPGLLPDHDQDFDPHTAYGESKVLTEKYTREANLSCTWTIIRPTNIWGPYHPRYPHEFWRVLAKGYYFHPAGANPIRCYGYVDNVNGQIEAILSSEAAQMHERVFYVGDRPIQLTEWVHGFSQALCGRPARIVPRWFVRALALFGDAAGKAGVVFPITSSRFQSMTTDYPVPMEPTFAALGEPRISLNEGIEITARWLKEAGFMERIYV